MAHTVDSLKTYYLIFLALMVLTAVTVLAAFIDFGAFNISIAMAIAILKGCLVLWFFMHVRHGNPLMKIFAVAGFVWLVILVAFTLQDYATRPWQKFPENSSWVTADASHFKAKTAVGAHGNSAHAPAGH